MSETLVKRLQGRLGKKFGVGSVLSAGDLDAISRISYGISCCLSIDLAIGRTGLPSGRLTELVGLESAGKSAHAYTVLAECQRLGGQGVLLESEQGFEAQRLRQFGVNTDDLALCQPQNLEKAFEMIEENILEIRKEAKFTGPVAIVLDSVAGLPSEAEDEGKYDDQHMGLSARIVSQGLRKLMWTVAEHKVVLIFLNQLRKTMERYGNEYASYGGLAIGYRSTLRIRVMNKKSDVLMVGKKPIGVWDRAHIFKNKIGVPFKEARYFFNYEKGIDIPEDLWQSALTIGLLKVAGGGFFKLSDGKTRLKREDWEDFITTKFKSVVNARKFMTQQAVSKGLLKLYE